MLEAVVASAEPELGTEWGILRASVGPLESRIRSLEGQGLRADRRAAQLASLAQALTEEQRALLVRLDRIEGRNSSRPAGRGGGTATLAAEQVVAATKQAADAQQLEAERQMAQLGQQLRRQADMIAELRVEMPLLSCRAEESHKLLDDVQVQVAQLQQQQQQQQRQQQDLLLMRDEEHAPAISELRDEFRAGVGDLREQLNSLLRQAIDDHAANIAEIQAQLKRVSQQQPAALAQLRLQLRELPHACNERLASLAAQQEKQAEALEDLRAGLDEASFASSTARAVLQSRLQQHSEEMRQMLQHVTHSACNDNSSSNTPAAVAAIATKGSAAKGTALMAAAPGFDLEPSASPLSKSAIEQEVEVRELVGRCNALQDAFEQATSIAAGRMDEQLLEVFAKMGHLQADYPERIAKVEENEVRLGLAMVRLESQESKLQGCLDRLDRAPTTDQVRRLCREEVQRRLDETNVIALMSDVDLQARAIQELRDRLQEVCDVVSYG